MKCFFPVLGKFWFWQEKWILDYHSVKFRYFPKFEVLEQLMRELVYTMFIRCAITLSNNCTSFHLWWKKKFDKTSKCLKILWKWLKVFLAYAIIFPGLVARHTKGPLWRPNIHKSTQTWCHVLDNCKASMLNIVFGDGMMDKLRIWLDQADKDIDANKDVDQIVV